MSSIKNAVSAFAFMACLSLPAPGFAQEQKDAPATTPPAAEAQATPPMPQIDPKLAHADDAYSRATAKLTKEQLATLGALEQDFAEKMEPEIRTLTMAAQLNYCLTSDADVGADKDKYFKEMDAFSAQSLAEGKKLMAENVAQRDKITFIDRKVLDDHMAFHEKLMIVLSAQMLQAQQQAGGFAKTNCNGVTKTLDKAAEAAAPAPETDKETSPAKP